MTSLDIAKLAGLLEGEGCFNILSRKGRAAIARIGMNTTDEDVAQWVGSTMGCAVYGPYKPTSPLGKKDAYSVVVQGYRAVGWMMTLYKFMHARRRRKICEILGIWVRSKPMDPGNLNKILKNPRIATCHPDRVSVSRGLCNACSCRLRYARARAKAKVS